MSVRWLVRPFGGDIFAFRSINLPAKGVGLESTINEHLVLLSYDETDIEL